MLCSIQLIQLLIIMSIMYDRIEGDEIVLIYCSQFYGRAMSDRFYRISFYGKSIEYK